MVDLVEDQHEDSPILFILYTAELIGLIEQHGFCPRLYADDMVVAVHQLHCTYSSVCRHHRSVL